MYNVYDSRHIDIVEEIKYAESMYKLQIHKVKQEEYVKDLMFADYVEKVKRNRSRYDMFFNLFVDAQSQTGKKKKSERKELAMLEGFLREDFFNDDKRFKVDHLVRGGYEGYYWDVYFKFDSEEFKDKMFYLAIPMMDNINVKNFNSAHEGQFAFYIQESLFVWTAKASSYTIEDIADYIKEYFKVD